MVPGEGRSGTAEHAAILQGLSRVLAWSVLLLACAVIAGWILDIRTLTSVVPGYNTMKANTALCLLALAISVLAANLWVQRSALVAVAVLTTLTLVEMSTGTSLGIDELFLRDDTTTGGAPPGRMAPATATALLGLAGALALVRSRTERTARYGQALLLLPSIIGLTALLGYVFDVEQLYQVASLTSVALHTAVAVLVLTFAAAALVPDGVLTWTVLGRGPGAAMVRQTAPLIIAGLVGLGLVRKSLGDAGVFGVHFGIALMVMVGILISVGATVFSASRLDVADRERAAAEDALRELNESLVEGRDEAWARAERLATELAEERRRFDRAVASTESVVWTVETTSGTAVPVYASPNVARVLGDQLLPGETATAAMARLVEEDQREEALAFRRHVRDGTPAEAELRLVVAGAEKWLRIHGVPRRHDDRTFYDGIITDSTEQHALAAQRERMLVAEQEQVEQLSELNRLRNEFIAVAGHELRTPVAVILGYCEMLADPEITEELRRESIGVIDRRARQLSELVERVFDLAKIDSGAMDLHLEPVPTAAFVADLVEEHRHAAEVAGVTLSTRVVETAVLADGPRLQQVFDNLLSNALKYTPTGGHVEVSVTIAGASVFFEVVDNGIGVAPDELPHLFERLFRASNARQASIPGTGLGLAVTKSLVEAHGGTMTVRPNEPAGLIFRVTLPRALPRSRPVAAGLHR